MKPAILFILHLPPPIHGAAQIGQLISESKKVAELFSCTFINLSTSKSVQAIGKLGIDKVFYFFKIVFLTTKMLIQQKPELCYMTIATTGKAFYKDLVIISLLKLFRKKILFHIHHQGVMKEVKRNKFRHYLYKYAFGGKRTKTILLSKNLYYDIEKYAPADKIYYCPNGIALQPGASAIRTEVKEPNTTKILFLSNMMASKGIYVLLDTCKLLHEQNQHFECHFVGDWLNTDKESFSQKIHSMGIDKKVFVHGKKINGEKNNFYKSADIFVLPSLDDSFPLVLLEAMQFSLPVISTKEGGIPDIVSDGQTGYLIHKNSPEELAQKLSFLINNPEERTKMGQTGKLKFDTHFNIDRFEKNFVDILKHYVEEPVN